MNPVYFIICRNMGVDYYNQIVEWARYHDIEDRYLIITDRSSVSITDVTYYYNGTIGTYPYGSVIIMDTGSDTDFGIGAKRNLCVRIANGRYCVMIDDNLDLIDYRADVSTTGSIEVYLGPGNINMRVPMSTDERDRWVEYGGHITFRSLTDSIINDPIWEEDQNMVIAGVLRHDHVTGRYRVGRIGTITESWKIYKYAVVDTSRLGHINYDPNLTILGEDVLLYTRLQADGKTGYIFNTALAFRPSRPDTLLPDRPGTSARINADYFVDEYMNDPSQDPAEIEAFLRGRRGSLLYRGSFYVNYKHVPRDLMPGTWIDPYIVVTATTGVPIIAQAGTITATGMDPSAHNLWNRYTACRNHSMLRIRPQGKLAYNICPPSIMIMGGDKYDHVWRFLILYGMVVSTGNQMIMRSLFRFLYDINLPIEFDRVAGHTNFIARLNDGHQHRDCRPFNRNRCK